MFRDLGTQCIIFRKHRPPWGPQSFADQISTYRILNTSSPYIVLEHADVFVVVTKIEIP